MKQILATLLILLGVNTVNANDWMARLDDETRVCRLSIPGAHDACTGYGFLPQDSLLGNLIAKTQELDISQQWAAGVRVFDLRPDIRVLSDDVRTLQIYHGEFATRQTFSGVFDVLRDSLKAHPTEFAIIVMQHEQSEHRDGTDWAWTAYVLLEMERDLLVDFRPDITVSEMRGRILVLSRDMDMTHGGYVTGWRFDADVDWRQPATIKGSTQEGRLVVQDFYNMTWDGGMPAKLKAIERLQRLTNNEELLKVDPNTWFINHTSGYRFTTTQYTKSPVSTSEGYRANAAETNHWLANLIEERENHTASKTTRGKQPHQRCAPTGIVMMDFAGVDRSGKYEVGGKKLVNAIINNNF